MPFTEFARVANLLDDFPVALVVLDGEARIIGHNAHWSQRMTPTVGSLLSDAVHHEDQGLWQAFIARWQTPEPVAQSLELRLIDQGNGVLWCEVSCRFKAGCALLSFQDRTSRRQQEVQLLASHRSASDLLHNLPFMIYRGRINREWSMEFVSRGCEQLTGFSAQAIEDRDAGGYGRLILPKYADYIWYGVQTALLRREPYSLTYQIRCANGTVKWVQEEGTGIFTDGGEVLGIEGAIFEVRPVAAG